MWRPLIIGILLFGNLALGQDKSSASESETETEAIVDQSPASSELVQTTSSESRSGLGKLGLLSTIKLVKDSTNLAEDMVSSGSLMNVFIQVSPDGSTDREIKKVLEEVAAEESDLDLTTVPNEEPQPPIQPPTQNDDYQGESNVASYAESSSEPTNEYRRGQSSEVGNEYTQQSEIPRPKSPVEAHLQRVRAQILKQQQEEVEQQQRELEQQQQEQERETSNSPEQFDDGSGSKHVIDIQSDRNKAYIKQQQKSDAAQRSGHVQKQQELEQQTREQQAQKQQSLEDNADRQNSVIPPPKQHQGDEQEEGAESDPQTTTIQGVFPQVSIHHQAYLAQKALQDQVRAQQQVIHRQQIEKLQAMQQEAFQKQNEIWQSAMQQQKSVYEQQLTKQAHELQQQQEFYAQQQQALQQQQSLPQQHQGINTRQQELHNQALNDKKIFEPILYPMGFNQQQPIQPEFNQQSLNEGYNQQQPPVQQQRFNQQTSFNQYQQQPQIGHPLPTPVQQPLHLGTPLQFVPPSPFPGPYQQPAIQPNFNQQSQSQQQGFDRQPLQQGFNNQQQQGQQPFQQNQQQGQQSYQQQQQGQQPYQQQQQGQQSYQHQQQGQRSNQQQQHGQQQQQGQQPHQPQQQRPPFQQQPVDVPHSQVPQLTNTNHNNHQAEESENNFRRYQPQQQQQGQHRPLGPSPVPPSQFLDANQDQPSLPNAALHSSAEQVAPVFSPVRETPLYTIYKVNENISPDTLKSLAHVPQRNTLYTVSTPAHLQNIPPPIVNEAPPAIPQQQHHHLGIPLQYVPPSPYPNQQQQGFNEQQPQQQSYNQPQQPQPNFNQQHQQQGHNQNQQGHNQNQQANYQQQGHNQQQHQQNGYNQQQQPGFNQAPPQQGFNQQQQSGFNQQPSQQDYNQQQQQPNALHSEQSHAVVHLPPIRQEPILPVVLPLLRPELPPPVTNFAGITIHHPSPQPFLGPSQAPIEIFGPRPTPFIHGTPILPQLPENRGPPPPLPPQQHHHHHHHQPQPQPHYHRQPPPPANALEPIPLPGNKDQGQKYRYSSDATFPPNELAFAAHQAAILGGPMFREDDPGHGHGLQPSKYLPLPSNLRHRISPPPEAPSPPSPPKRKYFTTADASTKHHIRDPHLGELEVKEIGIGQRSSIPRNILANLLRVTTGDELELEVDS